MPRFSIRDPRIWLVVLFLAALVNAVPLMSRMSIAPKEGDTPAYLLSAFHLNTHGVYSSAETDAAPAAEIGREPGYSALLAALMWVSPEFAAFTPACLATNDACPIAVYRPAQRLNLLLVVAAGAAIAAAALLAGLGRVPAAIAGGYVVLNPAMNKNWAAIASDPLAVALVSLTILSIAWTFRRGGGFRGVTIGLSAAALALTKAAFLWGFPLIWCGSLAVAAARGRPARAVAVALLAAGVGFLVPVSAWTARNAAVGGEWVFTDNRSTIALSTREVFDHMTPRENLIAIVYWTRGFGAKAAARIFGDEAVRPFDFGTPGGYYAVGQYRPGEREAEARNRGMSRDEARREVDRWIRDRLMERPLGWAMSMPALFWRGLWGDEFIVVGLPALIWLAVRAVRRRRSFEATIAVIALFNLLFHAAISLNIPRYQATAVPALALATAFALDAFVRRRGGGRGATPDVVVVQATLS